MILQSEDLLIIPKAVIILFQTSKYSIKIIVEFQDIIKIVTHILNYSVKVAVPFL